MTASLLENESTDKVMRTENNDGEKAYKAVGNTERALHNLHQMTELATFCESELAIVSEKLRNVLSRIQSATADSSDRGFSHRLVKESFDAYESKLSIETGSVLEMLRGNVQRWRIHLESTRIQNAPKNVEPVTAAVSYATGEALAKNGQKTDHSKQPRERFSHSRLRRMPIVGDVHLGREEWPSSPADWENFLSLPWPIKLTTIVYAVNQEERAFNALSLRFAGQKFESYDMCATKKLRRILLPVKLRTKL